MSAGGTRKDVGRRITKIDVGLLKNCKNENFSHLRRPFSTCRRRCLYTCDYRKVNREEEEEDEEDEEEEETNKFV